MTSIRLLANVADEPMGAVLRVSEDRARRLVMTGYAERFVEPEPRKAKKPKEE